MYSEFKFKYTNVSVSSCMGQHDLWKPAASELDTRKLAPETKTDINNNTVKLGEDDDLYVLARKVICQMTNNLQLWTYCNNMAPYANIIILQYCKKKMFFISQKINEMDGFDEIQLK